jgi:hypothetical protein
MPESPQKIISAKDEMWLGEDRIARIVIYEGFDFEEADLARQFETYSYLGLGPHNKRPVLVNALPGFVMNKEARDLAASQSKLFFTASAVVSGALSTRIFVNFLASFYDFGLPIKLFATEEEALVWLKKYC